MRSSSASRSRYAVSAETLGTGTADAAGRARPVCRQMSRLWARQARDPQHGQDWSIVATYASSAARLAGLR